MKRLMLAIVPRLSRNAGANVQMKLVDGVGRSDETQHGALVNAIPLPWH